LIVGGAALLVVILIAAWLANALLGPLRELTDGVRRFASGNYDVKVPTRTRDEVASSASPSTAWSTIFTQERHHRDQEPRERGAPAQRAAGAHRQSPCAAASRASPTASPK